ncbi:hypothetical protein CFI11_08290 [Thalassococcus sp. S3]|nr:hypothetical protein CFI11_08290 [Thalassococcus sp. S3]
MALTCAALMASPALATSKKEEDCTHQAAVAAAVQQARLDGVPQNRVAETITEGEVSWPDRYSNAIPIFAAQIYTIKKRDLRETDLRAEWMNTCMSN